MAARIHPVAARERLGSLLEKTGPPSPLPSLGDWKERTRAGEKPGRIRRGKAERWWWVVMEETLVVTSVLPPDSVLMGMLRRDARVWSRQAGNRAINDCPASRASAAASRRKRVEDSARKQQRHFRGERQFRICRLAPKEAMESWAERGRWLFLPLLI